MILFFKTTTGSIIAADTDKNIPEPDINKLKWLFGDAILIDKEILNEEFVGPRKEMVTPWSTNSVEITQNMGITGISRIEEFRRFRKGITDYDPMLQSLYTNLDQKLFSIDRSPEQILHIDNISLYNEEEGLALSSDEIDYLNNLSRTIGRRLTDSEVFGFSQVNSEHCRHKIFNGTFIIDGVEKESTLFRLIKKTTETNPNQVVSAYKDNCAFIRGPVIEQFAPTTQDKPDLFIVRTFESVLSLKAETHNFPTTVEPFNGASTGTGGEIRDRIAGGLGALPIAGTAVYMTSYPRPDGGRQWEKATKERPWLYQTPEDILIKASNGASDFGNKFGQPLICGSVLTFEHSENNINYGYDKVIMLAGGIGIGKIKESQKKIPEKGDLIVLMGGDNYRIGMGGGSVSSVDTGKYHSSIELNAVQRANPEMQKRVFNALRALVEMDENPVISIHDHGAGGHLNCLSELVAPAGGKIDISKLPVGDPTLSAREIIGNESQERMGLLMKQKDLDLLTRIAERERAPIYIIGEVTGDQYFTFEDPETGEKPIDLSLASLFGEPPKTIMIDQSPDTSYKAPEYSQDQVHYYLEQVLQLEEVACKDWLTNKVDRSVTGRVARQQCAGPLQLPLSDLGAIALDYRGRHGMATSVGHAPAAGLIDPGAGSVLSIAEALTNIIWAPLTHRLSGVSLSANWNWPCRNPGEDARLFAATSAASDFAINLGINIPTGKDSLSMTKKYSDQTVLSPGTVIITAAAEVEDIRKITGPVLMNGPSAYLYYIDMSRDAFKTGGSSLAQVLNTIGDEVPSVRDPEYFRKVFDTIQELIADEKIISGHDISAGGMIVTLLEMCFSNTSGGVTTDLSAIGETDTVKLLFSQNPGIIIQAREGTGVEEVLRQKSISYFMIGRPHAERTLKVSNNGMELIFEIDRLRDKWFSTSYLFDRLQSGASLASERYDNYSKHELKIDLKDFTGIFSSLGITPGRRNESGLRAAIIREKGVNGDREMAYSLWLAGFDVKDVHMTDLINGRESLESVNFIVFVGGFSNSDVLGSAKGWAGAFLHNEKARRALESFYNRSDTLSLGVCNGCQLMVELDLLYPDHNKKPVLLHNSSNKFESGFISVKIPENNSIMLCNMAGMELGIWVAHGEGRFSLPYEPDKYKIPIKYRRHTYPANPNGSDFDTAALCSDNGRHLAMMPHLERSIFPWQCGYYPEKRIKDDVTPWIKAFINAANWVKEKISAY
jgi:phosphoribosylformylglycinamidine synthase